MSGQSIPTEDSENVPQMYGNCGFCHTPLKQQQIIAILGGIFQRWMNTHSVFLWIYMRQKDSVGVIDSSQTTTALEMVMKINVTWLN